MTGPRARRRQQVEEQILEAGRSQLAEVGAAALSLRAVARELDMVSSAVYRYVSSRDELLTLLVVDAYTELAAAVQTAVDTNPGSPRERLGVALRAFRAWAVGHPAEFALLYGSPVPGYHAPAEQTNDPGTRVIAVVLGLLAEAGPHPASTPRSIPDGLQKELEAIVEEFGGDLSDSTLLAATGLWSWLIGAVGLEVFGGYGETTFGDPGALFDAQLESQLDHALGVPAR